MVQSWRALHANLLANLFSSQVFYQRITTQLQNSDIKKCILMAAPEENFILKIIMAASQRQLQRYILMVVHILHFLL